MLQIPFNKPYVTGHELWYLAQALKSGHLSGDGKFTKDCQRIIKAKTNTRKALLTHSCTAALEMAAILCDVGPGDEVILPSYTFVSTASAFALRGATPVFVDVRPDTLNLNEILIEDAITPKTKVIVPVHYAGVPCAMQTILEIAKKHGLLVVEDAAQGFGSAYRGIPLGAMGDLACFSFHETKNVISGEGGALLINNDRFEHRAELVREKGTNRTQFFRGEVDKYTWLDLGSSYLPNELTAAFLKAQLEAADSIQLQRGWIWYRYHEAFEQLEKETPVFRPAAPSLNGHMYYLLMPSKEIRTEYLAYMKAQGIHCTAHYVPLHSSPYGQKVGRTATEMPVTNMVSERLVRLPLWLGVEEHQDRIIEETYRFFGRDYDRSSIRLPEAA